MRLSSILQESIVITAATHMLTRRLRKEVLDDEGSSPICKLDLIPHYTYAVFIASACPHSASTKLRRGLLIQSHE